MRKIDRPSWVIPTAIGLAVADAFTGFAGAVFFALVDWNRVPAALQPSASNLANAFPVLIASAVGALVAIRRPNNIIGWLLLLICLSSNLLNMPPMYAAYGLYLHPGLPLANWALLLSVATWPVLLGLLLVLLPLVFPDGRLLSRRWLVPIALFGGFILLNLVANLDPAAIAPIRNPIGINALSGVGQLVNSPPFIVLFVLLCCPGVAGLFVRYRRGTQQEREQLKWLLGAIVLLLLAVVVQSLVPALSNVPLIPLAAIPMPIAIGIAVLRYRLYDIDLIFNKALVYGGLAALITAAYVLIVIGIGAFVGSSRQLLLSIVATLLIAVSFHPLRQRTQQLANRLIYGRRATPYETLSQFSEHLSETFSQEGILDRMSRILAQATGAERAEVWVRSGSQLLLASSSPANTPGVAELAMADGTLPAMERDQVVPVFHQGELLGALTVIKRRGETMNAVELKLLNDLAAQAGLVLKNVGLNRELMARLQDLRASRQRLVTAQDEERRRIERDLHDGAQQHLVALKVKVGLAQVAREEEKKTRLLAELKQDADAAIDQLRELARGVYPPLLASEGLEAALRGHLRRSTVAVELDAAPLPRQPRELESAVYFCCLEALQNVSKYAEASKVRIRLWTEASTLGFAVEDDGKGFDLSRARDMHGIENMRDRVEALGGTLTVSSAPGEGTRVVGQLPMPVAAAVSPAGQAS